MKAVPLQCASADSYMNYWIEVYWPHRPGEVRGEDGALWLYYHEGKRRADKKIRKGDRVLFYETKKHPDQMWPGSETIFAAGTVAHVKGEPMRPAVMSGGKKWMWLRKVRKDQIVPEPSGIPMSKVREVLGWSSRAPLRRGPMRIEKEQFERLAGMLGRDLGKRRQLHRRTSPGRQSDPQKRVELEKIAIGEATRWYEAQGYSVRSVERDCVGWDLEAECESHVLRVEVKGLSGRELIVGLTPNEYAAMQRKTIRPLYRLFVVSDGFGAIKTAEFAYSAVEDCWADADSRRLSFREIVGAVASL